MMQDRVIEHIPKQGYFITDPDPDLATLANHSRIAKISRTLGVSAAGGAWRTDPQNPQAVFVMEALRAAWGDRLIRLRALGGLDSTSYT